MSGVVGSADQVEVAWLDRALREAGIVPPGVRLERFSAETIGTGKVGENVRFTLTWEGLPDPGGAPDCGLPRSVIGKFASTDPTSRKAGLLTGTYVREVGFYRHLAGLVDITVPLCHSAEIDTGSGEFVLILEDLAPARQGDQLAGCTPDEAALAVEELAGLHAPVWGAMAPTGHDWLIERSAGGGAALAGVYTALVPGFLDRYSARLEATVLEAAQRFTPSVQRWLSADREPFTLLHGDYRLDNMLFGTEDGGYPLAVVDWQTVAVGPGLSDVAYFLGAGLDVENRRKHEEDLFDVYLDAMAARGIHLDRDEAWLVYRLNAFAGLHMAVVASQLVGRDERGDEMFCVMAERHAAQIEDLDSFGLVE
ncbi:MAG: DUF1679 domain-containing protein [Actinobacteria bacterium ATB1]|nr:DUF1679 domain-containing protein [Actinobacteria bacterium ATB1]